MLSEHGHGKKLCIGIMWHNANVLPHPPVTRGLNIVKEALLAAGHEGMCASTRLYCFWRFAVIEWEPLKIQEIQDMMVGASYRTSATVTDRRAFQRDIWYAGCYEDYTTVIADSGEPLLADMAPEREDVAQEPKPGLSAYELWQVHKTKRALREEYLRAWNATAGRTSTGRPIDAIVAPVAACVAPPHGMNKCAGVPPCRNWAYGWTSRHRSAVYTSTWNGVDYPALVLPIAKLDPAVDVKHERTDFMSDEDRESWNWCMSFLSPYGSRWQVFLTDKPETALHAPICVQLVAQTLEEEALLGMGEIVDAAVKAHLTR
jgi:amidase